MGQKEENIPKVFQVASEASSGIFPFFPFMHVEKENKRKLLE